MSKKFWLFFTLGCLNTSEYGTACLPVLSPRRPHLGGLAEETSSLTQGGPPRRRNRMAAFQRRQGLLFSSASPSILRPGDKTSAAGARLEDAPDGGLRAELEPLEASDGLRQWCVTFQDGTRPPAAIAQGHCLDGPGSPPGVLASSAPGRAYESRQTSSNRPPVMPACSRATLISPSTMIGELQPQSRNTLSLPTFDLSIRKPATTRYRPTFSG